MNKILITGGHGFIPSYTIEEAKRRGYKVITNVRSNRYLIDEEYKEILKDVEVYQVDSKDTSAMQKLVEQVDGVIHLSAMLGTKHVRNAKNFYINNLFPTIDILEACAEYNVPIVFISVGNYFEHNNYSNSKVAAEREVLKYAKFCGVRGNVVRALNAVGSRQKVKNTGKIMSTFITEALKDNGELKVYGGKENCSFMDLVYAGDVAKVLLNVLEDTEKGLYNAQIKEAGTGIAPSVYEIAEMILKEAGTNAEIVSVPMREGETNRSTVKAENPYPIEYRDLKEVIKETIEYYRTNQYDR